ncbi:hypothetical protein EYF80_040009 [Liparis tanakae]|uniref:Uncharacterized protein n=1 Tax=Liparis tanakae TaxID=230148 RepID=A0A4Z2G9P7_9TELE|nr:hypothetical protein EYF80_040009 [Liparis tanakae]
MEGVFSDAVILIMLRFEEEEDSPGATCQPSQDAKLQKSGVDDRSEGLSGVSILPLFKEFDR